MTVHSAAAADLDELDRATTLAELQRLVIDREVAAGLVPPGTIRPMFPWEVAAHTNFAEMHSGLTLAQQMNETALNLARQHLAANLIKAVAQSPTPAAAQRRLNELVLNGGSTEMREVLAQSTAVIEHTLESLYDHGAHLMFAEAKAQRVTNGQLLESVIGQGKYTQAAETASMTLWQKLSAAVVAVNGTRPPDVDTLQKTLDNTSVKGAYDMARQASNVAIGAGRAAQQQQLPTPVAVYASELLDSETCGPCAQIDGYEYVTAEQAYQDYPDAGPYVGCDGEDRCRGTLVFSYEESDGTAEGADPGWDDSVTPVEHPGGDDEADDDAGPTPPGGLFDPPAAEEPAAAVPEPDAEPEPTVEPTAPEPVPEPAPAPPPPPPPAADPKPELAQLLQDVLQPAPVKDGPLTFSTEAEGRAWAEAHWPDQNSGRYTPAEILAVKQYTGQAFAAVNAELRGAASKSGWYDDVVKGLDSAIKTAPRVAEDVVVTRGTTAATFRAGKGSDLTRLVGRTFTDKGYMSTAVQPDVGLFRNDVDLKLTLPKGAKAIYVSHTDAALSGAGHKENEMILARATKFTVTSVQGEPNGFGGMKWVVHATVVVS